MSLQELIFGPSAETIRKHHEVFKPAGQNPLKRTRTVPMKVLCLGSSRTGTASMYTALTRLGYNTYHGFRAFADHRDFILWPPAYLTKFANKPSPLVPKIDRAFFDQVIGHIDAITDVPCVSFWRELIEAYPDAKIVLVQRDEDAWFRSFDEVFIAFLENPLNFWIQIIDPVKAGPLTKCINLILKYDYGADSSEQLRRTARRMYRARYAAIRQLIKDRGEQHRLLEFDLKDGWQPLCEHLGKPVPKESRFQESTKPSRSMRRLL